MRLYTKIIDLFGYGKKYELQRTLYLSQFKKSWEDRTTAENIICECLYNLEFHNSQNARYLGGAESVLIIKGLLKGDGSEFPFENVTDNVFGVKVTRKETYREFILRLSKKFLKEREIL
jgi:hypothetical protein